MAELMRKRKIVEELDGEKEKKEKKVRSKNGDDEAKSIEIPCKISLFYLNQIAEAFGPGMKGLEVHADEKNNLLEIRLPGLLPVPFLGIYVDAPLGKAQHESGALLQLQLSLSLPKANSFVEVTKSSKLTSAKEYKQVIIVDLNTVKASHAEVKHASKVLGIRIQLHFDHPIGHCFREVSVLRKGADWIVQD